MCGARSPIVHGSKRVSSSKACACSILPVDVSTASAYQSPDCSMPAIESAPIIQHAIQLAVAPVFLLSGVAGLLAVMAGRLARIIDRARDLEQRWAMLDAKALARARTEIPNLERRRHLASWAVNLSAAAALLVRI